jgi:ABC-2 type transport system ATP-binding protein
VGPVTKRLYTVLGDRVSIGKFWLGFIILKRFYMPSGITIYNLVKSYRRGRVKALDGINASFLPGRTHGLIGPNGSGKTTLMGCLLGLLHKNEGIIDINGMTPDDLAFKFALGYVPERLRFDMWMKAWDFMVYHGRLLKLNKASREARITNCLERIGLEPNAWHARLKTYSRGMLQRLGLAQALLGQPQYLFLDEPTSGMDPAGVMLFRNIVREESARGALVLLSSHQLSQVEQLCDEVHFIEKGRIVQAVTQGADTSTRVLRVRWSQSAPVPSLPKDFPSSPKVRLMEERSGEASFEVDGDEGARQTIEALVRAGYPVVDAIPDTSRLERLFTNPKEKE